LLTLKAVRALRSADVVLIDDLVNRAVLAHARSRARVIEVGKRGGCKSTPQDFIERLMVRLARAGRIVARVKGGDPFVFGRGGEELQTLRAAGIDCEVVSGLTAGIAVPATLGIPVTHRDCVSGVTLVTGHSREGEASTPNWTALAASGTTLVIYMGMSRLATIVQSLMAAGVRPDMPAAAIESGTWEHQQQVVATLAGLELAVVEGGLKSPAILVVGEVARLAQWRAATEITNTIASDDEALHAA
jgi:uroporphyrin-III C-methyltransferase